MRFPRRLTGGGALSADRDVSAMTLHPRFNHLSKLGTSARFSHRKSLPFSSVLTFAGQPQRAAKPLNKVPLTLIAGGNFGAFILSVTDSLHETAE